MKTQARTKTSMIAYTSPRSFKEKLCPVCQNKLPQILDNGICPTCKRRI